MEKSTGRKINTAVFISGRGSNLKSLIKYSKSKNSLIRINLVISSKKKAKGLQYPRKSKIKYNAIIYKNNKLAEKKIIILLNRFKIDLICLAGFMKILSKDFIKTFKKPILNIHPSLLPKYKGLDTHKKVLENRENYTGSTVHVVNSKLDSGKIILQKKIKILKYDTVKSIEKKLLKIEHKLYPEAIRKFISSL